MLKKISRCFSFILAAFICFSLLNFPADAESSDTVNLMRQAETLYEMDMSEGEAKTFWLQYSLPRSWVYSVEFHDTLEDAPLNIYDFSANFDKSVVGWYTPEGVLHIAAEGKVTLPENSSWLFAYFTNLEEIKFNGCVDTSRVKNMDGMFYFCRNLKELDVSFFDTSSTTSMSKMFGYCEKLETLDISSFDTSDVEDFSFMFTFCRQLPSLDLSGFDTSSAKYMVSMFYRCESLKDLDTSSFDFSNVLSMVYFDDFTGIK